MLIKEWNTSHFILGNFLKIYKYYNLEVNTFDITRIEFRVYSVIAFKLLFFEINFMKNFMHINQKLKSHILEINMQFR